jgi:tetratricopeptide (TPR) repeat protein
MQLADIFKISKGTKVILTITFTVSALAVTFAFFYYRSVNRSEDPRINKARELLARYDRISGDINSIEAFFLLDTAFAIFSSLPDYETSFEIGVIYNNKCSALLLMAIYDSSITENEKNILLNMSMKYCDSSISIYRKWITEWDGLTPLDIDNRINKYMRENDPAFKAYNYKKIVARRINSIISARVETPRRLSVSLSNKGTIYRHMMKQDSSLLCYQEALSLWKDNRTAKSNLNVLMGGEPVKPTLIQSLFPPDKNKK